MGLQLRVVRRVAIDHLEDVLAAAGAVRRRDQPLDVEHVGIEEEVHHRLEVVGIGAADVGRDDHAWAVGATGRCGDGGAGLRRAASVTMASEVTSIRTGALSAIPDAVTPIATLAFVKGQLPRRRIRRGTANVAEVLFETGW